MNNVLLTIGIPTYNGEKYIGETIEIALSQILKLKAGDIEILVSDNASTDRTKEIVEHYVDNYPGLIKYFRNDENLGFDKNVDLLFKRANGKYVEVLGDDDYFCDGALSNILKIIQQERLFSVIVLNVAFKDISTGKEYGVHTIEKDLVFENGDDFFQYVKWRTSAISSLIFLKEEWNSIDFSKFLGNQWIHISAIIDILKRETSSCIISQKSVIVRTGNARWSNNFGNQLKIGLDHLKVISYMVKLNYKSETYSFFLKDRFKTNLNDIYNLAPFSFIERIKIASAMISLFKNFPTIWIINLPFLLFVSYPIQLLRLVARRFYKVM